MTSFHKPAFHLKCNSLKSQKFTINCYRVTLNFFLVSQSEKQESPPFEIVRSVLRLCLTLCDPMGCSVPGSSIHGIFQARILEWLVMPSSRGSSLPRDQTRFSYVSCIGSWVLYNQWHPGSHRLLDSYLILRMPLLVQPYSFLSGVGNGNLLQYSCLENPMNRGAWQAAAHGVAKSQTQLSD